MKIKYIWTRENLKEKLFKMRVVPNIIFLVLGVIFYLYITWYGFIDKSFDVKVILIGFAIYFVGLILVLLLSTKAYVFLNLRRNDKKTSKAYGTYCINVDDKGIESSINNEKIFYKWEDITKFKKNKKGFFVSTKEDRLGLLFEKKCITIDEYNKLLDYVEEKLK